MSREEKSKHITRVLADFSNPDDLCACGHSAWDHYLSKQMPCVQCECGGLKKPKEGE